MKVLVISSLYPNAAQPRHGIFIEHRVAHTFEQSDDVRVVAPVPWFPFSGPRWGRYGRLAAVPKSATRRGFRIMHPRHLALPKIGQTLSPLLMALSLYAPLKRLRREFRFDVIDAYYLYPDGVAAGILAKLFGVPFTMSALGSDVSLIPRWWPSKRMIIHAVRRSGVTTAVCRALTDELSRLGAPEDKLRVVEHGVDLHLFTRPIDRAALRTSLGFVGPTVLSVGHLIDRKGHDLAIRAVAALPGVRLVIAGDGPRLRDLRALAASLGIADRVIFLGHVDQAMLPELYGAADVSLLCSDREDIANVLLESIACGTPVVATPAWGSPDVISCASAGRLAERRSEAAIRQALADALASPSDRSATRRHAERYDWKVTGSHHRCVLADASRRFA